MAVAERAMTPDLALFPGVATLVKPDVVLVPEVPVTVVLILSSSQAFDAQVKMTENYLLAGVRSCWLVEPTLLAISVTSCLGVYQTFNCDETLRDPTTSIELELAPLFS